MIIGLRLTNTMVVLQQATVYSKGVVRVLFFQYFSLKFMADFVGTKPCKHAKQEEIQLFMCIAH